MLNLEYITQRMETLGFNQSAIADHLGVSRESVSKWFSNQTKPRANKLLKLALFLECKVNDLKEKITGEEEPILEFRKRGNCKIDDDYKQKIYRDLRYLDKLEPYLPTRIQTKSAIDSPQTDYHSIQNLAQQFRNDILRIKADTNVIELEDLIQFINNTGSFFVPVLWSEKEKANACHLYLPKSKSRWIYVNLDTQILDIKFWLLHEIGHMLTPSLTQGSDESELFADSFAAAVLYPHSEVEKTYQYLTELDKAKLINHIIHVAWELKISPITVLREINKYADEYDLAKFELDKQLFPRLSQLQKQLTSLSEMLFNSPTPSAKEYIDKSKSFFKSDFFNILGEYVNKEGKGAGIISRLLNISKLEALEIYEELTKNGPA